MSYLWHDGFDAYGVQGYIDGEIYDGGSTNIDTILLQQPAYFTNEAYVTNPSTRVSIDTIDGIGYSILPNTGGYWAGGPGRHLGAQDGVVVCFHMKLKRVDSGIGEQSIFRTGKYLMDESYNTHMQIFFEEDGTIKCVTGDNAYTYKSAAGVILAATWQRIEIKHVIGTQPQILQVRVDGVSVISVVANPISTFTQSTSNSISDTAIGQYFEANAGSMAGLFLAILGINTQTQTESQAYDSTTILQNANLPSNINIVQFFSDARLNMLADHFYVFSTDGNTPCDFIGNAVVRTMLPAKAGAEQQWRQIGGDLRGPFTAIDEQPADGDASCIADNTSYENSLFLPDVVPPNVIDVFAVAVTAIARGASGGENIKVTISDGTNFGLGPEHTLTTSYTAEQDNFVSNPSGGYWAYKDLTTLQFGVRRMP